EIMQAQFRERRLHARQLEMAVGRRASVPWNMLDYGKNTAIEIAFDRGAAKLNCYPRLARKGPVADYVMGTGNRHIENGGAIHGDAERSQIVGDKPRAEIRGIASPVGVAFEHLAQAPCRRAHAPLRRTQARDAPAFLIDEDRCIGVFAGFTQVAAQIADLRRRYAIACEQNKAE